MMAILQKELQKGRKRLLMWTFGMGFMLLICIFIYPEMKMEMETMNDMFANMGTFTQAFGMDQLNFGTLIGYYGIECGNMMGMMGGLFAAYLGVTILSKEEKEGTADFLLTHPIRRSSVVFQKMLAVLIQIIAMNTIIYVCSLLSVLIIGEELPLKEWTLLHVAYLLLQVEISMICFGLSAFVKRGSIGIGLGLAGVLYFMNLIRNIVSEVEFLKYITPYAYADSAGLLADMKIDTTLLLLGMTYMVISVGLGFVKYRKKDITS